MPQEAGFYTILVAISDRQILNTAAKGGVASTSIFVQKNVTAEQVAVPILRDNIIRHGT